MEFVNLNLIFKSAKYALIDEKNTICFYSFSNNNLSLINKINIINECLSINSNTTALILNSEFPVANYNFKNIKKLFFTLPSQEVFHLNVDKLVINPIRSITNVSYKIFIYIMYPNETITNSIKYKISANVDLISSLVGFYGGCKNNEIYQHLMTTNNSVDFNKFYEAAKTYNNVLWLGNDGGKRGKLLNDLKNISEFQIIKVTEDISKTHYVELMSKYNCFASLSLDGTTPQCYRDTEICLCKVPNIKLTESTEDISLDNNIYLCNRGQNFNSVCKSIKINLFNDNYTKLNDGYNIMVALNNLQRYLYTDFGFFSNCLYALNKNIYDLCKTINSKNTNIQNAICDFLNLRTYE